MNTEIMNALMMVREAEKRVDEARQAPDLTEKQRNNLQSIYALLLDIDDQLVLQDIQQGIDKLKQDSNKLETLANKIAQDVERWRKIADAVHKAAKGVGTLADILAKAASAGLLGIPVGLRRGRGRKGTQWNRC
jgi:archaellum component FlaC